MNKCHSTFSNSTEEYELNELSIKYTGQKYDELEEKIQSTIRNLLHIKRNKMSIRGMQNE